MNINIDQLETSGTRHLGFGWTPQVDTYVVQGREYGEFYWESWEDTGYDSYWYIYHIEETGDFQLVELGGRGPDVWDQEHGIYESPLAAMAAARVITKARVEGGGAVI